MRFWPFKKRYARVVMLFQEPTLAQALAKRIAERAQNGSQQKKGAA